MINFLSIALLLAFSSQNMISSLNNLSQNSPLVVPTEWTRIVQVDSHFCLTFRKNYENDKINHSPCDSYDDNQSWKIIPNKDGSYQVQLKSTKYFLFLTNKSSDPSFYTLGTVNYSFNFNLVQSKNFPELFSLRPSNNQNICFETQDSKFSPCDIEKTGQFYFFDTSVTPPAIIPNIYYNIIRQHYLEIGKKCLGNDFKNFHCSDQDPQQAFKFIPTNDGSNSYYIISGLNKALAVPEFNQNDKSFIDSIKFTLQNHDPKNPLQKFKVIRSPYNYERYYIKLGIDLNLCMKEVGSIDNCPLWESTYFLYTLSIPCGSELIKTNVWYFLKFQYDSCLGVNPTTGSMFGDSCKLSPNNLFKFEYNEQNKSYYIYNKGQGDKVLTVTEDRWNNPLLHSYPNFQPKNPDPKRIDTQSWNTTRRFPHMTYGFELINRYTQYALYNGSILHPNYARLIWAEALHSEAFFDGPLLSFDNSKEFFENSKIKNAYCPATYLHQFN